MPSITWLRKRAIKARYLQDSVRMKPGQDPGKAAKAKDKAQDKCVERWVKNGRLPPPSYPVGARCPAWPQELLDQWDFLDQPERQEILDAWPRWQAALARIAERRKATEATEPVIELRRKRKQREATVSESV